MKQNPLISVVVPVYKIPEDFLRSSIESVLNQTVQDFELILVDDGSYYCNSSEKFWCKCCS